MTNVYFIEGIDGSGKSTMVDLLAERRPNTVKTRLPYYENETGRIIREMIDNNKEGVSEEEFQRLMIENYIEHFNEFVVPELKKGNDVIISRGILSMYAYGTYFGAKINDLVDNFDYFVRSIDIDYYSTASTIVLDIPVDLSMERLTKRDHIEAVFENRECLEYVRDHYLENDHNAKIINAEKLSIEEAYEKVEEIIEKEL